MDLTLLYWGIGLIVVGFILGLVGLYIERGERRGVDEELPSLPDLVVKALLELFTAVPKMFQGNRIGPRVQAFGSVLAWIGLVLVIVFVIQALADGTGTNGDGGESEPPSS